MAYEKTNWTSETPINTANLNKIENGIEQSQKILDYTSEEQIIGSYLGKPLYRKTISTTTPSSTEDSIVTTIPNNAFIRKIDGIFLNEATSQLIPINFHYSEQFNVATYILFADIHMKVSTTDYTEKQLQIIIEYTKTTD